MMRLIWASAGLRHMAIGLAALAVLSGAIAWLRHDAAEDRERELRARHYGDRVMRIEETRRYRDEIETLDRDRLLERLHRWLRP